MSTPTFPTHGPEGAQSTHTESILTDNHEKDEIIQYYLGDCWSALIMMSTLILAILAILLNLGVVTFYRRQIKNLVPFIYSILAGSDFCTGICTALHSVLFLVLLIVKNEDCLLLYWLAFLTYFSTMVTFRLSAFVSLTFSVIRTINILSPFKRIKKRAVCTSIVIYSVILITLTCTEIGLLESETTKYASWKFFADYFYRPASLNNLFLGVFNRLDKLNLVNMEHFCTISTLSILPILLPATFTMIATIVQIYILLTPSNLNTGQKETESTKKNVSITIAIISSLFFFCSLFVISLPLTSCVPDLRALYLTDKGLLLYLTTYMPMFINAALNPLILTIRGEQLNQYIRDKIRMRRGGVEGAGCNLGNLGNGLSEVKGRPERCSVDTINTHASVSIA